MKCTKQRGKRLFHFTKVDDFIDEAVRYSTQFCYSQIVREQFPKRMGFNKSFHFYPIEV
ncbi:hypothetical protein HMPREF9012_1342 [Bacteroidetes bacterium oral taxon 272 str. F0290]|nr:hypothetical protein HMPREF9012_1342 [Bacteroidetes bacterium oral taxon 272 str. F0290]